MAQALTQNPIQQRIEYLNDLWNEFAENSHSCLLRWLTDQDGAQLLATFFEIQNHETGSEIPDFFLTFDAPFDSSGDYGARLVEQFQAMYEEAREELQADGIDSSWSYPLITPGSSHIAVFVEYCSSFLQYYRKHNLQLVLVLMPERIADPQSWQNWLLQFLQSQIPDSLRVTTIDRVERPYLEYLAERLPERVVTITPELDMPGARREIVAQAGGSGPGVSFRRLFIELTDPAVQGEGTSFAQKAEAALRITQQQQWPALQIAVHMLVGATYLKGAQLTESLTAYEAAKQVAQEAQKMGDPSGGKLVMQAEFGKAAALLSGSRYAEAAQVYEQTAPVAQEAPDILMTVEAWRMAGYCYEQAGNPEAAWRCGWQALDTAEALDESIKQNSTLPYVGQGLLRLTRSHQSYRDHADAIRTRMVKLVGPTWEEYGS